MSWIHFKFNKGNNMSVLTYKKRLIKILKNCPIGWVNQDFSQEELSDPNMRQAVYQLVKEEIAIPVRLSKDLPPILILNEGDHHA